MLHIKLQAQALQTTEYIEIRLLHWVPALWLVKTVAEVFGTQITMYPILFQWTIAFMTHILDMKGV